MTVNTPNMADQIRAIADNDQRADALAAMPPEQFFRVLTQALNMHGFTDDRFGRVSLFDRLCAMAANNADRYRLADEAYAAAREKFAPQIEAERAKRTAERDACDALRVAVAELLTDIATAVRAPSPLALKAGREALAQSRATADGAEWDDYDG